MVNKADFDVAAAHAYFAADCFNRAWDLIEKIDRSAADDCLMVSLNQASIFHWLSRPDCGDKPMSVGYWQASRIQALLGHADEARRHAETCLGYSGDLEPFYLGYAYEALARAARLAGAPSRAAEFLDQAEALAAQVKKPEDRALLTKDLAELRDR